MDDDRRHALGKLGEDLACQELARRGYAILARRYRTRYGEIDIVARAGDTLVFAEVKTRDGSAFGTGAEAVTALKQRRLVRMASEYLLRTRAGDRPCRFDVVVVDVEAGDPRVELFENAFGAG